MRDALTGLLSRPGVGIPIDNALQGFPGFDQISGLSSVKISHHVEPGDDLFSWLAGLGNQLFQLIHRQRDMVEMLGINPGQLFPGLPILGVLFQLMHQTGGGGREIFLGRFETSEIIPQSPPFLAVRHGNAAWLAI